MALRRRSEMTHYVDFGDLESFIKETYGFTYNIAAAEECGNDTSLTYHIDGVLDLFEHSLFEQMLAGEWLPYKTRLILNKLHQDGHIPAGNYLMTVDW